MPMTIYFMFFISLHACSSIRLLGFADKEIVKYLQHADKKIEPLSASYSTSCDGEKTMQPKNSEPSGEDSESENKGKNVILPLTADDVQDQKRQERLMIETPPDDAPAVETMDSKEDDDMGEDIVVMDYAQPHRKPPIHNKKP